METLLKCIMVASGNDSAVAMAEYVAGSEGEFVNQMNQKAAELGMKNTHFTDCCGLTDSEDHFTNDAEGYCPHVPGADHEISGSF